MQKNVYIQKDLLTTQTVFKTFQRDVFIFDCKFQQVIFPSNKPLTYENNPSVCPKLSPSFSLMFSTGIISFNGGPLRW